MIGAAFSTGDAIALSEEMRSGRLTALEVITMLSPADRTFRSRAEVFHRPC